MDRATGAFKSIGLLCFMMWMSGSQLHIFSIMSTMSGVFQPLSAILSSGKCEAHLCALTHCKGCGQVSPCCQGVHICLQHQQVIVDRCMPTSAWFPLTDVEVVLQQSEPARGC